MSDTAPSRDLGTLEDEVLVDRIRSGADRDAAASVLFGRYQRRVYLWCLRMVRDHERALDLAQESQLRAFRALDDFRSDARFSSWLFAIVRNACLSSLRPVRLTRDPEFDLDTLVDDLPDAAEQMVMEERERLLWRLVEEVLDPLERQALVLRTFERIPVDEITHLLGLDSRSGARGLLQKARRKLRAELQRRANHGS